MTPKPSKWLDAQDHKSLALWAAGCAEHVLPYFRGEHPEDNRPRNAIEAARAWARGELPRSKAREAAFAAHAAARDANIESARLAARAAGHARHAAAYAVKAATAAVVPAGAGDAAAAEREWQVRRLPEDLRPPEFSPSGQ